MWRTNLKIALTVIGTLVAYTAVANMIPQVESAAPEGVQVTGELTPERLVELGERLFEGAGGCTACHGLGTRAPDLLGVAGANCETRKPDLSCKEYLHESLVDPTAYVVEGFQPIMPDARRTLGEAQIWALVAFLESQGGEVTVTPADLPDEDAESPPGGPPAAAGAGEVPQAAGEAGGATDPREIIALYGCTACHQLEGEGGPVGPPFAEMAGQDADYLRRGILAPNADTAPGYEDFAGTMPANFGERMTATQLEALVDFLASGR